MRKRAPLFHCRRTNFKSCSQKKKITFPFVLLLFMEHFFWPLVLKSVHLNCTLLYRQLGEKPHHWQSMLYYTAKKPNHHHPILVSWVECQFDWTEVSRSNDPRFSFVSIPLGLLKVSRSYFQEKNWVIVWSLHLIFNLTNDNFVIYCSSFWERKHFQSCHHFKIGSYWRASEIRT